jgi:hypothetical protein
MKVLIALPAYGGSIKTECVTSLLDLAHALFQHKVQFAAMPMDASDIEDSRNLFASYVIENREFTHLLSIDNDLEFPARAVLKLLASKLEVIGCAIPRRTPTTQFNVVAAGAPAIDGICEVQRVGTGIMLIHRSALEKLLSTGEIQSRTIHGFLGIGFKTPLYGFFDRIRTPEETISEDYSFCDRWRAAGGKVYALIDEAIGHIWTTKFVGRMSDHYG